MSTDAVSCAPSLRRSHCPALSSAGSLARSWKDYSVCLHSPGGLDKFCLRVQATGTAASCQRGAMGGAGKIGRGGAWSEWGCRQSLPGLSLHWSSLPISPCLASAGEWPESRAPGVHGRCLEDHVLR